MAHLLVQFTLVVLVTLGVIPQLKATQVVLLLLILAFLEPLQVAVEQVLLDKTLQQVVLVLAE